MERPCLNKRKWKATKEDTQHQLLASMHVHTHDLHAHTYTTYMYIYIHTHTHVHSTQTHTVPPKEKTKRILFRYSFLSAAAELSAVSPQLVHPYYSISLLEENSIT